MNKLGIIMHLKLEDANALCLRCDITLDDNLEIYVAIKKRAKL